MASNPTVLVVEDEPGVRRLVADVLSAERYSVLTCGNGEEAVQVAGYRIQPVDLLICDVNLPGPAGFAVAHQFETRYPEIKIKVLYISGYSCALTMGLDGGIGGRPFLQKPFTIDQLRSAVQRLVQELPRVKPTPEAQHSGPSSAGRPKAFTTFFDT